MVLNQKGDVIEREVYGLFTMLSDCGGFNDGLNLLVCFVLLSYNSSWFSVDLNASLFRVTDPKNKVKHFRAYEESHVAD